MKFNLRKIIQHTKFRRALFFGVFVFVIGEIAYQKLTIQSQRRSLPRLALDYGPSAQTEIAIYRKRLRADSKNSTEWALLGELLFSEFKKTKDPSQLKEAEDCARKSLRLRADLNSPAKILLAQTLDQRHSFPEAIALVREVLKENANRSSALFLLVTAQVALGDYDQAIEDAKTYVRVKPEPQAFAVFGMALSQRGRIEEANLAFENALRLENSSSDARTSAWIRSIYARLLLRKGEHSRASVLINEALEIVPQFPLALSLQGEVFELKGDFKKAAHFYLNAFESTKETPYLLSYARVLENLGRAPEAKALRMQAATIIRETLRNPEESVGHRLELAEILLNANEWKEPISLLQEELKIRHSHEVYFAISRAYFLKGDISESRIYFSKVMAIGAEDSRYSQFAKNLKKQPNGSLE